MEESDELWDKVLIMLGGFSVGALWIFLLASTFGGEWRFNNQESVQDFLLDEKVLLLGILPIIIMILYLLFSRKK